MKLHDYEEKHLQTLRSHLGECTVLLKSNGDFPLEKAGKIAAYGSGVRRTIKGGTGSGEVNSRYFITIEEGLKNAGFEITTEAWLTAYEEVYAKARKEFHKEIKARAKANHTQAVVEGMGAVMREPEYRLPLEGEGDTAIYVLSRISGEGNDRVPEKGDILLSETEISDILALQKKYPKFLLVLNVGGVVDLSPVMEVENILILSQLGVETGTVLADLLLGRTYPSGKLATTWSAWEDYSSVGEFGNKDDTVYKEGIYVGYRYFDTVGKRALFPFGYGLGYTTFARVGEKMQVDGDRVTIRANIRNTGNRRGQEVLQVYVSSPEGRLDQPYQALAAFAKSGELAPEETEELILTFALRDLASYEEEAEAYILEKGEYLIRIGTDSVHTDVCGKLLLEETIIVRKVRSACGKSGTADWKPQKKETMPSSKEECPVESFKILPEDIPTEEVHYDGKREVEPWLKELTDEELALINIGAFDPKGGLLSIIGNASTTVAGAAGETVGAYKDRNFPVMVMADGPAGLRLTRQFYRDEKGVHSIGETIPESILEFMPKPVAWLMSRPPKIKKGIQVEEQYATAIPIGTALAQSWNLDFAHACGDIVGEEMERFGVQLWLAPALNIHRSIQCGRNFEYFSEDPLLSGRFAAALTNGVQAHPGCGTTIKHYAANNQETNRYANNSCVSERAMREIYLRGFEICIRESQPAALMTSYNLLNGVHTSERRDLTEDILRTEFGFRGIVMTDWVTGGGILTKGGKYTAPNAGMVAAAGGDLFMPGCKQDYEQVLAARKDGTLSRRQLEENATRVFRMARRLNGKKEK